MKHSTKFTLFLIFTLIFSFAAQAQNSEWIRTYSDNGEFSIEVPAEYGFFADKDGFSVSAYFDTFYLREMNMLNAYQEKTLLSFETYKANNAALEAIREKESRGGKISDGKKSGYKYKQVVMETADSYAVKRYFSSKNYIYILTAATRKGETAAMKRFFDSVRFQPGGRVASSSEDVAFAALKASPIEIDSAPDKVPPTDTKPNLPTPTVADESVSKLVIVSKPLASYSEAARSKLEQGIIRMRITFSKDGPISKLALLQTLQEGLLRQAVFAAIRIKFIPQEKNNEPLTVTKVIEYSFNIY
jgi:Gram-negative bacterial TonB protein C-terminal